MQRYRYYDNNRRINKIVILIIFCLLINIIYKSYDLYVPSNAKESVVNYLITSENKFSKQMYIQSIPLVSYTYKSVEKDDLQLHKYETSYYNTFLSNIVPIVNYVMAYESMAYQTVSEIYPHIASSKDNITYDDLEKMKLIQENEDFSENISEQHSKVVKYSLNELQDFNFLSRNIYTIDASTQLQTKDVSVKEFIEKDIKIDLNSKKPKILIFHTHAHESFVDSRKDVSDDTVIGLGNELAKILKQQYGINVLHHTGVYDNNRQKSYEMAEPAIKKILSDNPSIEVAIDIHVDSPEVPLLTTINGKETAKIMFFNGICKYKKDGKVYNYHLTNPYLKQQMALSLQLQLKANELFPNFTRKIYIKGYRYNMHICPYTILIEVGSYKNTVQQGMNAMEPLAEVLYEVLK